MDKLVELFSYLKEMGYIEGNKMAAFIAESHLDSKGALDIYFIRDVLKENVTKSQMYNAYYEVFGTNLPTKFTYDNSNKSTVTREEFLIAYEPAAYLNVREWILYLMFEYGQFITRQDLFNWILSTAKPKVFLGDLNDIE